MQHTEDMNVLYKFLYRTVQLIDDDRLEDWTNLFEENGKYIVTTKRNMDEKLDVGVMYAVGRSMLRDRVSAIRHANIFGRHSYRHIIGLPGIVERDNDEKILHLRTNFCVIRTQYESDMKLFAVGEYQDILVRNGDQVTIKTRTVVCDSQIFDTLLAIPL